MSGSWSSVGKSGALVQCATLYLTVYVVVVVVVYVSVLVERSRHFPCQRDPAVVG